MSAFKGSCLCGLISYEVEGKTMAFFHCHCQRCRKSTGTGHASNIRVKADNIKWTRGGSMIKSYKVPEAERFKNVFCSQCGSILPRHFPDHGFVVIPAGTLDSEPEIKPQGRTFYTSRAGWSCQDDLPTYEEYLV